MGKFDHVDKACLAVLAARRMRTGTREIDGGKFSYTAMILDAFDSSELNEGQRRCFASITPAKRPTMCRASGIPVTMLGGAAEQFGSVAFQKCLLDFVRKAHPGVVWGKGPLGKTYPLPEYVLHGFVGARLVAIVMGVMY